MPNTSKSPGRVLAIAVSCVSILSCDVFTGFPAPVSQAPISASPLPALPVLPAVPTATGRDGSKFYALRIGTSEVWLYTPPSLRPNMKFPAVLIAPAGSTLMTGMNLGEGDQPEHWPYLDAGFVVLAYALAGADDTSAFAAANGGLENGRAALAFLEQQPFVDPDNIFAAGHSSAGDTALLLAAHEPSLAGVAAFNSAGEGCWFQSEVILMAVRIEYDEFESFCQRSRAASHLAHLDTPVFVFSSEADQVVPAQRVRSLAAEMEKKGVAVTLKVTQDGGHYQSMLDEGIPSAIQWMRSRR